MTERKLKTYINVEGITTEIIGVTARALTAGTQEAGGFGYGIIVPLVIILIMINAGWFVYFRRRK